MNAIITTCAPTFRKSGFRKLSGYVTRNAISGSRVPLVPPGDCPGRIADANATYRYSSGSITARVHEDKQETIRR